MHEAQTREKSFLGLKGQQSRADVSYNCLESRVSINESSLWITCQYNNKEAFSTFRPTDWQTLRNVRFFVGFFFFKAILQMLQYRRPCHQGSCVFYYLESRGRTQPGRVFAKTVTLVRPFRRSDDLIRTTAVEWRKPIVSAMSVSRERKLLSLR